MNGNKRIAFAQDETAYFSPETINSKANKTNDGFVINGQKMIIDGQGADAFLIVAQTDEDEAALFLVDATHEALQQKQRYYWMLGPMHLSHCVTLL